jgi:3-methyladenine DNA glycosylase AlkC
VEPFKNLLNAALIDTAAGHFARHQRRFDRQRFVHLASDGLAALEMKARAMQICAALEATLPARFADAAGVIEASLAPPRDGLWGQHSADDGLAGWILWPVGEFVARRGLDEPERALQVLHGLTQRFTAEFAIRPFIVRHPDLVFATLRRWCSDDSAHVRRLVSEGSRPRLPWGLQLRQLIADPSPTLPLLEALQDDPSEYVRRSVANHLNDIAKDHPALVVDWLRRHLPDAGTERRALLRRASRTLVKQGHAPALQAWGVGGAFKGEATLLVRPKRVKLGESVTITLRLVSTAARAQTLAIDYAVHHVKANGSSSPKVFKGWQLILAPRTGITLARSHSMRLVTTRRYHAGHHVVHVQVNGRVVAEAGFDLQMPPA